MGTTRGTRSAVQKCLAAALLIMGMAAGFVTSAWAGTDNASLVPASGSVSGTTRDVMGKAVPGVKVSVHRVEGDVDRTVISGAVGARS